MIEWLLCVALASGRLLVAYLLSLRNKRQAFPGRLLIFTASNLVGCCILAVVDIGGVYAAAAYAFVSLFEAPVGRAVFMLFMMMAAARIAIHETILVTGAAIMEIALAITYLFIRY